MSPFDLLGYKIDKLKDSSLLDSTREILDITGSILELLIEVNDQCERLTEKNKELEAKIKSLEQSKTVVVVNPPVINSPSPKPTVQNPWDKPEGIEVWC